MPMGGSEHDLGSVREGSFAPGKNTFALAGMQSKLR